MPSPMKSIGILCCTSFWYFSVNANIPPIPIVFNIPAYSALRIRPSIISLNLMEACLGSILYNAEGAMLVIMILNGWRWFGWMKVRCWLCITFLSIIIDQLTLLSLIMSLIYSERSTPLKLILLFYIKSNWIHPSMEGIIFDIF